MSNIITALLLMAAGCVLYQCGYRDGYDRGWKNGFGACLSTEDDRPKIYMDHTHGGDD